MCRPRVKALAFSSGTCVYGKGGRTGPAPTRMDGRGPSAPRFSAPEHARGTGEHRWIGVNGTHPVRAARRTMAAHARLRPWAPDRDPWLQAAPLGAGPRSLTPRPDSSHRAATLHAGLRLLAPGDDSALRSGMPAPGTGSSRQSEMLARVGTRVPVCRSRRPRLSGCGPAAGTGAGRFGPGCSLPPYGAFAPVRRIAPVSGLSAVRGVRAGQRSARRPGCSRRTVAPSVGGLGSGQTFPQVRAGCGRRGRWFTG